MRLMGDANVAPEFINEPIRPIADSISVDVRKVLLGDMLYHDTRLSADNTVSCASCHGLDMGGVDNKQYSEGVGGQLGGVNAPTVYNAAYNFVQFWDGRAGTLAEQALSLYHRSFPNGLTLRSIGVRTSGFVACGKEEQKSLFDSDKEETLDQTVDAIRSRYGLHVIRRGVLCTDKTLYSPLYSEKHLVAPFKSH